MAAGCKAGRGPNLVCRSGFRARRQGLDGESLTRCERVHPSSVSALLSLIARRQVYSTYGAVRGFRSITAGASASERDAWSRARLARLPPVAGKWSGSIDGNFDPVALVTIVDGTRAPRFVGDVASAPGASSRSRLDGRRDEVITPRIDVARLLDCTLTMTADLWIRLPSRVARRDTCSSAISAVASRPSADMRVQILSLTLSKHSRCLCEASLRGMGTSRVMQTLRRIQKASTSCLSALVAVLLGARSRRRHVWPCATATISRSAHPARGD